MKKFISLVLTLCLIFSAMGCNLNGTGEQIAEKNGIYPFGITDQAGREVIIEKKPEKIVSGYYISTSALIALRLEDKIVGVEAKADKRPIYKLSAPEIIELPSVGTAKEFDIEGCVALEPDLVILPLKLKNAAESLEDLGITVLLVDPENQTKLEDMINIISDVTETKDSAQKLISFISDQKDLLSNIKGEKPRVYLAGNSSFLSTCGKEMYQSDMIALAGGKNVSDEIDDTYWVDISYEQFLLWDPDYIILASDALYSVEDILNDKTLSDCRAVKNGKVFKMPGNIEAWDSPLPAGILGSVWLASVLHGDEMPEDKSEKIIKSFYEEFYGFAYVEE